MLDIADALREISPLASEGDWYTRNVLNAAILAVEAREANMVVAFQLRLLCEADEALTERQCEAIELIAELLDRANLD